ncbi:MAG: NAD(P)H-quinone oxidoreductase subunit I, partial [Coleofasciculaceae cyanobacterium]
TEDPMVTPLRELAYLPKGVFDPHDLPAGSVRPGLRPEEMAAQMAPKSEETAK